MSEPLLTVRNLKMHFPIKGGVFLRQAASLRAVDDVSFTINKGETLGLVGESGCGKSTVARAILQLYKATAGDVLFEGVNICETSKGDMRSLRKEMQIIFQDPAESLNARHTVASLLEEPFQIHHIGTAKERKRWVKELLLKVGLPEDAASRFPHEFSGGQRQRIGIARAIALNPKFVVCDEPVSALDVSVQSQILNLLMQLQRDLNLTLLFIAHDLSIVKHISDRIIVMYLGRIVEVAKADNIYQQPLHPYTQSLIQSIPIPDPTHKKKMVALEGDVPSPIAPPKGCHFHTRCPYAQDICRREVPELRAMPSDAEHMAACHLLEEINQADS